MLHVQYKLLYFSSQFGVCGSTGSGKSTLIMSLVHLSEVAQGTIMIDDQCLTEISGNIIRSRITCIPPDAVVFNQSVR
jgi:ABC-type multidrug transport system fused ATPase/permease subunit